MTRITNPLTTFTNLPPFSLIKPEDIKPAIEQAINDCRNVIEEVSKLKNPTWDNFIEPITEVSETLDKMWSPINHINAVVNTKELRQAYESCIPLFSDYYTWVGQHEELYKAYLKIEASQEFANFSTAQKKSITNSIRDFKLSGIGLDKAKQKRYGEISKRKSELTTKFANNVLDATMVWTKNITNKEELSGLPDSILEAFEEKAKEKNLQGYLLTLTAPSLIPVLTYCDNQKLREEIFKASNARASEFGPAEFDNTQNIKEILQLRHELAEILGFKNYAELSVETKMAKNPAEVLDFLNDLAKKAKPQGEQEFAELKQFAKSEYNVDDLEPWDVAYYSEKMRQKLFNFSEEELRPYFPENKVITGLFEVLNRVFDITIKEKTGVDVWHKDVKFFEIFDKTNTLRACFYLDLYAREHKRGGAWMADFRGKAKNQIPVAFLTCNFSKPVGNKPALFTHNEVETLFHETGHGIHHMLTKIEVPSVAGISGVPWDAVELPSQFLENWCWQPEALEFISGHYKTGESLPKEMLDKMLNAKNFNSAMQVLRQLRFGLFDFMLHTNYNPAEGAKIKETLLEVMDKVSVVKPLENDRFYTSFSHIFAGGYAAGYYSYLWAEVLSADAFSRFEEEGIFNKKTGQDFLTNILEMGGSEEPSEIFKRFRGRAPKVDALLRHKGIKA